jgi:FkbH-like protein
MAFVGGIDLDVRLGDFNTYTQDILDPGSWLYTYAPNVLILAAQARDIVPVLWDQYADLDSASIQEALNQTIAQFRQLIQAYRRQSDAHVIVHSLETPIWRAQGLLDSRIGIGQAAAIEMINEGLRSLARESKNVYVLDLNSLIARRGAQNWYDARKWMMARMPIAAGEMIHLAREWLRFLHPITGRTCKVLAVDLDNTIWGGVIGEDGMDGIKLDDSYPGAAYRAVQRAILDLHQRGIILAVCSKNNPAEAMEAIEKHAGMLLRSHHFATIRANWQDKAANLRDIARELNVGIDSVAFLDNNPVEREWVRDQLPEVTIIDLPTDPMLFADALRQSPVFERLELTEEDKVRGRMYGEQRLRSELAQGASSLEDFYRSLQMLVHVEPVNPKTLARAAQLTQKTNQFNLATHRYTEEQMAGMADTTRAFTIHVADRFGDNGIVGVAILRSQSDICEIDTFLLSCRVIGRTVETAFLAVLAADAAKRGDKRMGGWFIPTRKNAPSAEFYAQHGFSRTKEKEGASYWERDLMVDPLTVPAWITLQGISNE